MLYICCGYHAHVAPHAVCVPLSLVSLQATPSPKPNRRVRCFHSPHPIIPLPTRQAWRGGFIAGILRYLFVLATGARELPPSPIGPAGRWLAKVAALASVAALALSIGSVDGTADDTAVTLTTGQRVWAGAAGAPSVLPCAVGVAVLCASFSVDFYQIWIVLPREAAVAAATTAATTTVITTTASTATLVAVTS